MSDPFIALIIGVLITGIAAGLFWPEKGLLALLKRSSADSHKEMLEDALKHIHDCEYNTLSCTVTSLAGHLKIPTEKAGEITEKLRQTGLVSKNENKLILTEEGRSYALRVIRVHRLWERFLADETSVHATDWHNVAEKIEHTLSPEEADKLAAQMGNPIIDPHGDPIPTAMGELPSERRGVPLNTLDKGDVARITHLEDEPPALFAQLIAMGLYKSMQILVIDKKPEKIVFEANGDEIVLAPALAENITVAKIEDKSEIFDRFIPLSSLTVGETGIVKGISRALRGQQRRRLMDLGVVPGSEIVPELESRSGNPVAYRIRGASIALRRQQSDLIYVDVKKGEIYESES